MSTKHRPRRIEDVTAELRDAAEHADGPPSLVRHALALLRREAEADCAVFTPLRLCARAPAIGADAGEVVPAVGVDFDLARLLRMSRDVMDYADELSHLHRAGSQARAVHDRDVYPDAVRGRMPLYANLLRPNAIDSFVMAQLRFRGTYFGYAVLIQSGQQRRFDARSVGRVQLLMPAVTLSFAAMLPSSTRSSPAIDPLRALSPREREVAQLIAHNLRNKEIARVLGTSPNTVRKQSVRIFEKLSVRGRVGVAALVNHAPRSNPLHEHQVRERRRR